MFDESDGGDMGMGETRKGLVIGPRIPSLVRRGCSADADLLYRTLVARGPSTGRDLARELGVAGRRVSEAVDELAAVGAITTRPGRAGTEVTWSARPPAEVVPALHRARYRPGTRRPRSPREQHATVRAALPEPLTLGEGLRHLVTRALTRRRLVELNASVSKEFLSMSPEEAFEPEAVRAAAPLDKRLIERGVPMRLMGVQPPGTVPLADHMRSSPQRKYSYRQALAVPMKLIVFDRKVALFPVDPGNYDRGYLEVTQAPVVSALVALFERHWAGARDQREEALPQIVLSSRERSLISLLAQGYTDATAARELGISPRSVSNILRALMDRLHVDNRFQLGLALGALRTVPLPSRPGVADVPETQGAQCRQDVAIGSSSGH